MNISEKFKRVKEASREMVLLTDEKINDVLHLLKNSILGNSDSILRENKKDLDRMDPAHSRYDR